MRGFNCVERETMLKELRNKGNKKVYEYMRNRDFNLYDCTENNESGYIAEFYKTAAGITTKTVFVIFNNRWRVVDVK